VYLAHPGACPKRHLDHSSRVSTVHGCDKQTQTDRQTDRHRQKDQTTLHLKQQLGGICAEGACDAS